MRFLTFTTLIGLAAATLPITPERVIRHVRANDLRNTLATFDEIATANGGNRAFGLPGYRASADFILKRLRRQKLFLDYREQEFSALFARVEEIKLQEVGSDVDTYVYGLTYSPSTSAEGVTAELVNAPEGLEACSAEGYAAAGIDAKDKIVLVERFLCPDQTTLGGRVRAAVAAGAQAVIVYNNQPTKPTAGTLGAPDPVGYRAAGWIGQEDGLAWKARLEAGEKVEVYFKQLQSVEDRPTWNIIAETKRGDPNNVIVIGGHLDSVQAGAGINDDGSGSSLVLALAEAAALYWPKLKIRFCFWGAEENGLLGSEHYVGNLAPEELHKIRAYLNFDMVGKGYYGVFDGDGSSHGLAGPAGSDVIEGLFKQYLEGKEKLTVTPAVFTGGSDYATFMAVGIPVGGLHTGTGVAQDPCYHQACDVLDNVNITTLYNNAKAAGYVLATLASKGKELIPKWNVTSEDSMSLSSFAGNEIHWGTDESGNHVGCGEDEL